MKTAVVVPLPFDAWDTFEPFIKRLTDTFRKYPPSVDCQVWAMATKGTADAATRALFDGINCRFVSYYHDGRDSGSWQFASWLMEENTFMVPMTSRTYFHRSGWLKRVVAAREHHGPGLYGLCANRETYALHICCRCFGIDSNDFREYPHLINSQEAGHAFETGDGIPEGPAHVWMRSRGKVAKIVMWDGVYDEPDWFTPANRFRHGDQSNVLVWDKHTDGYRDGTQEQRAQLESYQRA
ncbi:MAG TPA: hypothetical protein VMQ76_02730 [Terracidiphilus sp.]|nr:hypothetical protein [Terracidiphilus sp.]